MAILYCAGRLLGTFIYTSAVLFERRRGYGNAAIYQTRDLLEWLS
ncbi:hypothetical protein [Methylotuvimicrobium sp. KM1]